MLLLESLCLILLLQTVAFLASLWFGYQRTIALTRAPIIALTAFYAATPLLEIMWNYTPLALLASPPIVITILLLLLATNPKAIPQETVNIEHRPLRIYLQHFLLPGLVMMALLCALFPTILKSQFPKLVFIGGGVLVWSIGFLFTFFKKRSFKLPLIQKSLSLKKVGQALLWIGIFIVTLPTPYWYLTIITPITAMMVIYVQRKTNA